MSEISDRLKVAEQEIAALKKAVFGNDETPKQEVSESLVDKPADDFADLESISEEAPKAKKTKGKKEDVASEG